MGELLDAAVSPANFVITSLAIFVMLYWLTVILGVIDLDFIDLDLDLDMDLDMDADGFSMGWLNSVLAFFNMGQIPVMVFFTFLIIPAWAIMMITNDALGITGFLPGMVVLLPVLFTCLFLAKLLTMPFIRMFGKLNQDQDMQEVVIGKICEVTVPIHPNKIGQARVKTQGAPFLLNVSATQDVEMKKGDKGLILDFLEERNMYLIEPYNN